MDVNGSPIGNMHADKEPLFFNPWIHRRGLNLVLD